MKSFTEEKLRCVYGGIPLVLFILGFQFTVWHSMQINTLNSNNEYMEIFKKQRLTLASRKKKFNFSNNTRSYSTRIKPGKILDFGWSAQRQPDYELK